jgi:hypothetical protein
MFAKRLFMTAEALQMTDTAKFMLGIAGAHWSAPVLVVNAAYTGPVAERFYWKMTDDDQALGCRIDRGTGRLYV